MRNRKLKLKFTWLIIFLLGVSSFSFAQIPLTIELALDIAEENNPSLRTSKLNLERSLYSLQAQRASLKPAFSLSLDPFSYSQNRSFDNRFSEWYTSKNMSSGGTFRTELPFLLTDGTLSLTNRLRWQNNESTNQNGTNLNKAFSNDLRLRYDQPIFSSYNSQRMAFKQLEFNYENAGISYALRRLSTENSITSQFYNVYIAQERLLINNAEYENSKGNYEIMKSRVEAGLSAREELSQAEVNLLSAESSVEDSKVSLANFKDNLKQTLGMPLSEDIIVIANVDEASLLLVNPEQAVDRGLSSRMELRQREISLEEAEMAMLRTKANDEFRGNVSLSLGVTGDDRRFTNIYESPTSSPSISISLSVPIFDWGARKARLNAQKTAQTIAALNYEDEMVGIELEIRRVIRALNNYYNQIQIYEKRLMNAQNSYDLSSIKYREGDITGMDLNLSQTQLSNAKISLMRARVDYKNQLLILKIATLYDYEQDKAIVPVRELGDTSGDIKF